MGRSLTKTFILPFTLPQVKTEAAEMAKMLEPITTKGRYFWSGPERFIPKGVVLQTHDRTNRENGRIPDPLADDYLEDLAKAVVLFKELGLNALYVFSIDNTKNHDAAMEILRKAGIYVLIGLSTPWRAISRSNPSGTYTADLLQHYFASIDNMSSYSNTLGVIVANSVINSNITTPAARYVRAAVRDLKRYMNHAAEISDRRVLPVGVSSSQIMTLLKPQFDYFASAPDDEAIDFYCFNNFAWCGEASMQISGYNNLVKMFSQTSIPVFFSEYGCNVKPPRIFQETRAIHSPEMTTVFSGGFVYEFLEGPNRYGLVKRDKEGNLEKSVEFENLSASLHACIDQPVPTAMAEGTWRRPDAPVESSNWQATTYLPDCPVDWNEIRAKLEDEEWVDVEDEIRNLEVEDLAASMWERFRLDGTGPNWS